MQVASIDKNRIVINVIVATLEEAQTAFPDQTWVDCPEWVGIGMSIDTPEPSNVPTAEENSNYAIGLLQQTDWATIPDVADPAISTPYLTNQQAYFDYRNIVRGYTINPVAGNINWPVQPTPIWS
jgi:hypothetical protein